MGENQLRRLLAKKAEWLYSPNDSIILHNQRKQIQEMNTEQAKSQTWTLAGRLVCDINNRPPAQSVPIPVQPLPHILKQRMPMTRIEHTEQRIIQKAVIPPPLPLQLSL